MTQSAIKKLAGQLIVSCQSQPGSPLNEPNIIAAIAAASMQRGAGGVRIEGPDRVRAVREALPGAPLIGLWKQQIDGFSPYITPQYHHAKAIAEAGADIVALDATLRDRPAGETLAEIVRQLREEFDVAVMADIDSLASAQFAIAAGVDAIGTTLYGYTEATEQLSPPGFELLADLVKLVAEPRDRPVTAICEGGIATPAQMAEAFAIGADAVVVGTAITGIDLLVDRYVRAIP
ncbi:MAG: N-acetylmannosamine-6-phosphate 2-epimerase [Geitlerinemataceae cyanobacterium]